MLLTADQQREFAANCTHLREIVASMSNAIYNAYSAGRLPALLPSIQEKADEINTFTLPNSSYWDLPQVLSIYFLGLFDEVRPYLAAIQGAVASYGNTVYPEGTDRDQTFAEHVLANLERIRTTIEVIQALVCKIPLDMSPVDLIPLAHSLPLELSLEGVYSSIDIDARANSLIVLGHPLVIEIALANLVRMKCSSSRAIKLVLSSTWTNRALVQVADAGINLYRDRGTSHPEEQMQRMFTLQLIASAYGWKNGLKSGRGGSIFSLSLPLYRGPRS